MLTIGTPEVATSDQALQPPKSVRFRKHCITILNNLGGTSGTSGSRKASGSKHKTPIHEDFGIHIYSTIELEGQTRLTKENRTLWNVKAMEYCQEMHHIKDGWYSYKRSH